jgi:hypothetical protein
MSRIRSVRRCMWIPLAAVQRELVHGTGRSYNGERARLRAAFPSYNFGY